MIKLGIVGVGKIVRDQHLPSIANTGHFELAATASRNAQVDNVQAFRTLGEMIDAEPDLQAVSLCMPPQYRFDLACEAIDNGLHVLLEKPPGATVAEVMHLADRAKGQNVTLYATWHSRHAPAVQPAKAWLQGKTINEVDLTWIEDVNKWHPGQDWIWQAGGLGVFDPGINGLSILTEVLPDDVFVTQAALEFPHTKDAPIAAQFTMRSSEGYSVNAKMDWRVPDSESSKERWEISINTDQGDLNISDGGVQADRIPSSPPSQ
ncbi:MAG: Gfo/Idh/MocA family oxidoreductase [Pseudomonadota bacterium]